MLSHHDHKTVDTINDFQTATLHAKASFDEMQSRIASLQHHFSDLQRAVAALDDKLRYNTQTVSVLEEQEVRLRASRRNHELELEKQTQAMAALRRPREDAEADKKQIAQDVDDAQGLLLRQVTALANGIVQAANDTSLVPELRRTLQDKKAEAEKWQRAVLELEQQAEKEEREVAALQAQLEELQLLQQRKIQAQMMAIMKLQEEEKKNSSKQGLHADNGTQKSNNNRNKKHNNRARRQDDGNEDEASPSNHDDDDDDDDDDDQQDNNNNNDDDATAGSTKTKKNTNNPSKKSTVVNNSSGSQITFSTPAEQVAYVEQKLRALLHKQARDEAALTARRDQLRSQNYALCRESEQADQQLQAAHQMQCDLLDELAGMTCGSCNARTLSAESGHDTSL